MSWDIGLDLSCFLTVPENCTQAGQNQDTRKKLSVEENGQQVYCNIRLAGRCSRYLLIPAHNRQKVPCKAHTKHY